MPTASEYQQALRLVTRRAVAVASDFTASLTGTPEQRRLAMLDTVPGIIAVYADGSASLGADAYEDARERYVRGAFSAALVVPDRTVKIRRAIAWAAEPFFGKPGDVTGRITEIVQPEVALPFNETIVGNGHRDPQAAGFRRVAGDSCRFCRMLSDRGAVFKQDTAYFASHPHCDCTAEQVFVGGDVGPEASAIQYAASKRNQTAKQKANVNAYLDTVYGPE